MLETKRTHWEIRRTFGASIDRVFAAFTEPTLMARWMWGGIGRDVEAGADLRVGGCFQVYTTAEQANGWSSNRWGMCGLFVEVTPPTRLVYTLHFDGPVGYNQVEGAVVLDEFVTVDFQSHGDTETSITFRHHGIPDDGVSAREHKKGVSASFDILERILGE